MRDSDKGEYHGSDDNRNDHPPVNMIQITEDQLRVIINEAIIAGERREQGLLSDDEMDELVVVQIEAVKSLQPRSLPGDVSKSFECHNLLGIKTPPKSWE